MARVKVNNVTVSQGVHMLFSLMTPNESSFATVEEVPKYVNQATPYFIGLNYVCFSMNDVTSPSKHGTVSYIYVWNNFRVYELPWDSAWKWWLAFLGVDMVYYWFHRFAHELNFLWAAHQVHHSSEHYNLSTALHQSVTQQFSWFLYYPYLWQRFWESEGISNKLSNIFKGPGWNPAKPRLGGIANIPEILSEMTVPHKTAYVLLSLTCLGFIIDQRVNAAEWELLRCLVIMALHRFSYIKPLVPLLAFPTEAFVLISAVYWSLQCVNQLTKKMKKQN